MHHQQEAQPVAPCGDADVCIYLLCHADRRTNRCHPSEATMAKAKELIREQARVSIQEKLKEMQKQVREAEKKRNVSIRKKNMEL